MFHAAYHDLHVFFPTSLRSPGAMKLFSILSLLGSVAAAPVPHELLLQVQELQAELSTQRQVIQELHVQRRLQAEESETRQMQYAFEVEDLFEGARRH